MRATGTTECVLNAGSKRELATEDTFKIFI